MHSLSYPPPPIHTGMHANMHTPLSHSQAAWYFSCCRMLYEGRVAWNAWEPVFDMGPSMFSPVVLCLWMNVISVSMLVSKCRLYRACP